MLKQQRLLRTCPVCECDNQQGPRSEWSRDDWTIRECRDCQMVYLENAVDYASLAEEFCWSSTVPVERQRRMEAEPLFSRFAEFWKKARMRFLHVNNCLNLAASRFQLGPVLDIGCGGGRFLGQLCQLNPQFQPFGIEIDPTLARLSSDVLAPQGGKVIQADALSGLQQFPDAFFTGIMMTCYLEHETNPGAVLRASRRTLQPGGRIVIKVPNFGSWNRYLRGKRWCGFRFPDHVNYFTPRTLTRLIQECGLNVDRNSWLNHNPANDNMYLVAQAPVRCDTEQPASHFTPALAANP